MPASKKRPSCFTRTLSSGMVESTSTSSRPSLGPSFGISPGSTRPAKAGWNAASIPNTSNTTNRRCTAATRDAI
jgi:hypothetical protein